METNELDLTSKQVAEQLHKSVKYVQLLAERGKLQGYKLGRDWRFSRQSVTVYQQSRRGVGRPRKVKGNHG